MPCEVIPFPGGGFAIACTRGRRRHTPTCVVCGRPGAFECDYPTQELRRKSKTCDRVLCTQCRRVVLRDGVPIDVCPQHAEEAGRAGHHVSGPRPRSPKAAPPGQCTLPGFGKDDDNDR